MPACRIGMIFPLAVAFARATPKATRPLDPVVRTNAAPAGQFDDAVMMQLAVLVKRESMLNAGAPRRRRAAFRNTIVSFSSVIVQGTVTPRVRPGREIAANPLAMPREGSPTTPPSFARCSYGDKPLVDLVRVEQPLNAHAGSVENLRRQGFATRDAQHVPAAIREGQILQRDIFHAERASGSWLFRSSHAGNRTARCHWPLLALTCSPRFDRGSKASCPGPPSIIAAARGLPL